MYALFAALVATSAQYFIHDIDQTPAGIYDAAEWDQDKNADFYDSDQSQYDLDGSMYDANLRFERNG